MHTSKIFNLLFLTLIGATAFSQEKIAAYGLPTSDYSNSKVSLFYGNGESLVADIRNDGSHKRLLIEKGKEPKIIYTDEVSKEDAPGKITGLPKAIKEIHSLKRLGTVSENNVFDDCYYSEKWKTIYFIETDVVGGNTRVTDTIKFDYDERIITVLEDSNRLYLLSYLDNSDIIYIRIKKPQQKLKGFEKTIQVSTSDDKHAARFSDFFKVKKKVVILFITTHILILLIFLK